MQLQGKPRYPSNNGTMRYSTLKSALPDYPESVVWESIIRSLKGAVADMAWYIGPTTSVAHIWRKLSVIFSTVASFDVLMQNF